METIWTKRPEDGFLLGVLMGTDVGDVGTELGTEKTKKPKRSNVNISLMKTTTPLDSY
jgi:hypothetical protein